LKAKEIREELAAYFLSGGRVEWQNDCAYRRHIFEKPRCLEIYLTLSQTFKFVMSFTDRVQCLSRFGFVHFKSQAFICKPLAFVHFLSCRKEK